MYHYYKFICFINIIIYVMYSIIVENVEDCIVESAQIGELG